ncbi:unnamed protein product [Rotaria sp. Silwood2]|nr:unnamed protein product [Rotaria sp. Silwood2]
MVINNSQSTTVTNADALARQLEIAYGLPAGSLRITNIVIRGITTKAGSGRRRRRELYRTKLPCTAIFTGPTNYAAGSGTYSVAVADLNRDTKPDIIGPNDMAGTISILLNRGDGTYNPQVVYTTGGTASHPEGVTASDLNGDGNLDIIVANYGANNIGIFMGTGVGTYAPQVAVATGAGSGPQAVAASDVNGDGNADIIVANFDGNKVGVFLGTGHGTFSPQVTYPTDAGSRPRSVVVADLNDDNKGDIIVANREGSYVAVFFNKGDGTFYPQVKYSTGAGSWPRSVVVADVNGDGTLDVIVANSRTNNVGIFLNKGDGTLATQTTLPTDPLPRAVTVADINDDGKIDILYISSANDNFGLYCNTGNGIFVLQGPYAVGAGSSPYGIAAADLNGDGKIDIVVGNHGTNNVGVFKTACN